MQRLPLPLSCLLCVYIQRNMRVNTGKGKGRRHWQLDTSDNILVARVSTWRISRHTSILYLSPSNRELRPYTVRVVYRLWNSYGLYKRFLLDVKAFWVKWVHTQPSSAIVLLFTNFTRFLMVQTVKKFDQCKKEIVPSIPVLAIILPLFLFWNYSWKEPSYLKFSLEISNIHFVLRLDSGIKGPFQAPVNH